MSLYWKLLLPARAGQERELETVQRQIDALWNDYDDADEHDEPRLLAEIEAAKQQRTALAQPPETLMRLAAAPRLGIDPAMPAIEAPTELAGPYGLDVSFLLALENFDDELVSEAYDRHDAAAMLDYKDRLLVSIADVAGGEPDDDSNLVLGLVVTTANWLAFWGEHGFGFEPIFDPSDDEDDETDEDDD